MKKIFYEKLYKNKIIMILTLFLLTISLFKFPHIIHAHANVPITQLRIHFISVGQADSIVIQQGSNTLLIDGASENKSTSVINYLFEQGITKLNYVIGTHLHDDHIAGLESIMKIRDLKINKIFLPKTTYTNIYLDKLLEAMKLKSLTPTYPSAGQVFTLGRAKFEFLTSAISKYSFGIDDHTINNSSLVIKVQYKNNTFLFTGDAEKLEERDLISSGYDLSADVLKVGHHGSATSTNKEFLDAVHPKYAVLTSGNENWCKLPAKVVTDRFKNRNVKLYRTDENGTIVLTSDGTNITFNCRPNTYSYRSYDYK